MFIGIREADTQILKDNAQRRPHSTTPERPPSHRKSAAEATAKLVPHQRKAARKEEARKARAGKGGQPKKDEAEAQAKAAKKATRRKPKK
ncbi:hypothetical protein [Streptomyces sp. NBC_01116]|uniref:hypothetical protein n=1 Tax=Streptomyces sp. NBC_01116 TaxID=2903752 RepID=UPI00352E344A